MTKTRFPTLLIDVESLNKSWRYARLLTKRILNKKLSISRSQFTASSKITLDLGGDSLDLVEIAIAIEKILRIRINEHVQFNYVLEIVDHIHLVRTRDK